MIANFRPKYRVDYMVANHRNCQVFDQQQGCTRNRQDSQNILRQWRDLLDWTKCRQDICYLHMLLNLRDKSIQQGKYFLLVIAKELDNNIRLRIESFLHFLIHHMRFHQDKVNNHQDQCHLRSDCKSLLDKLRDMMMFQGSNNPSDKIFSYHYSIDLVLVPHNKPQVHICNCLNQLQSDQYQCNNTQQDMIDTLIRCQGLLCVHNYLLDKVFECYQNNKSLLDMVVL